MCKKYWWWIPIAVVVLIGGCADRSKDLEEDHGAVVNNNMNSALWIQTSAEYHATAIQSYRAASDKIGRAMSAPLWTAMLEQSGQAVLPSRAAVILDVDETVLDNSPYLAKRIIQGEGWEPESWDNWVAMASAKAIPGSVEFINHLTEAGIDAVFITNRECVQRESSGDPCPQKTDTIENLKSVGISVVKPENVLLKSEIPEWTSEKQSRRAYIADKYRVLMLVGDDLGDFLPDVKMHITPAERRVLVDQ
ncbi:5'-nucleotidase, lipoprotein e(P4) family [Pseudoteredinibacter isoporae]|uniref:Acid phosphatase n=1 Tax=Pseudoteredinibacter isoporae TaxID=570281 RepID=A0A7X0MV85_9GAMM|nr:HAD family acid phosphatase [Pseudoteredinibacter isoporae]MBB6521461.1 acid phosphatase [Pseudoteredinibacter isoporae]NHO87015.1 acid phosphatase [Pseudoteredinibacter isoporae]NIB24532.1 acid phosphatase [Pseudoteredinibacter isoporae]